MKIFLRATREQEARFLQNANTDVERFTEVSEINSADAVIFDFQQNESSYPANAIVVKDCMHFNANAENTFYINTWPFFLENTKIEVGGKSNNTLTKVFTSLGKEIVFVEPEIGLLAARVISMIVNEGYFAVEDGVSEKAEIDIAMKLGTGYPFGPFEWSDKIGIKNIAHLLKKLALNDSRYTPSKLLLQEANS